MFGRLNIVRNTIQKQLTKSNFSIILRLPQNKDVEKGNRDFHQR
jgi:hypothetical protein